MLGGVLQKLRGKRGFTSPYSESQSEHTSELNFCECYKGKMRIQIKFDIFV